MDNSRQRTEELIDRYLEGSATADERAQLERWYADALLESEYPDDLEIEQVNQLKKEGLMAAIAEIRREQAKPFTLWPRIRIAAGIAAAIATTVFGVWFFTHPSHSDTSGKSELVSVSQDVAPGRNGATITLATGKVIELSGAKKGVIVGEQLRYDDHTLVSPGRGDNNGREQMQNLTASTAKGQTYEFTLPDGTKVWLNADSKISFPSQFNGAERKVLLSGEAYFAVVHNAKQPFRVESDAGNGKRQVVEDIGTEFNINAYADESTIKTTLVEGMASVNQRVLKPNQQAVVSADRKIAVSEANTAEAIAWKAGSFRFNDASIETVMRQLARWYNIEVIYQGKPNNEGFTGRLSRSKNISEALTILEKTKGVHFKIEGRRVTIIN